MLPKRERIGERKMTELQQVKVLKRVAAKVTELSGYETELKENEKTNGTKLGIGVRLNDGVYGIVYLPDKYLKEAVYSNVTEVNINDMAFYVLNVVKDKEDGAKAVKMTEELFSDKEKFLENVTYMLVNKELNNFGGTVLTPVAGDLAYEYKLVIDSDLVKIVRLKYQHLEKLGISLEELHEAAIKNTPRIFPGEVMDIADAEPFPFGPSGFMYIASNNKRLNGAVSIMYPEVQKELCETLGDEFYVIPSSVHEVLCVRDSEIPLDNIKEMVKMVNDSVVLPEDKLSDTVFVCRNGKLEVAC